MLIYIYLLESFLFYPILKNDFEKMDLDISSIYTEYNNPGLREFQNLTSGFSIAEDLIWSNIYNMSIGKKIFDAFYCVDKSRSKKYGGSGLGLAITKEIMNQHKFAVRANSIKNEFVEFLIDFIGDKNI